MWLLLKEWFEVGGKNCHAHCSIFSKICGAHLYHKIYLRSKFQNYISCGSWDIKVGGKKCHAHFLFFLKFVQHFLAIRSTSIQNFKTISLVVLEISKWAVKTATPIFQFFPKSIPTIRPPIPTTVPNFNFLAFIVLEISWLQGGAFQIVGGEYLPRPLSNFLQNQSTHWYLSTYQILAL